MKIVHNKGNSKLIIVIKDMQILSQLIIELPDLNTITKKLIKLVCFLSNDVKVRKASHKLE